MRLLVPLATHVKLMVSSTPDIDVIVANAHPLTTAPGASWLFPQLANGHNVGAVEFACRIEPLYPSSRS